MNRAKEWVFYSAALILSFGCRAQVDDEGAELAATPPGYATVTQILSPSKISFYKAALPKVGYERVQSIFNDSDTFWYDHEAMIPTYQDSVGLDVTVGMRKNNDGAGLINIIPGGREMFSDDAKTWAFPFAHTAGTDNTPNLTIVNFMSLPKDARGQRLPVVYRLIEQPGALGGLGVRQWRWFYPQGTMFGELLLVKDSAGKLFPVEVRTRERFLDGWSTNVFRPFPTATQLSAAIKKARPAWQSSESLRAAVEQLDGSGPMRTKSLSSGPFTGVFNASGSIDTIPDFGDEALVRELLSTTTFRSSYGKAWKSVDGVRTFAASSAARFSVVPANYEAGLVENTDASCSRCHQDAQRPVRDFNDSAILYGDIWGSDKIFSFHIFDQSRYNGAADENRAIRPEFSQSGMVVPYDPGVHRPDRYKELK